MERAHRVGMREYERVEAVAQCLVGQRQSGRESAVEQKDAFAQSLFDTYHFSMIFISKMRLQFFPVTKMRSRSAS